MLSISVKFSATDESMGCHVPKSLVKNNWFTYFPGDFRWSLAICWMVSCARWGASEIGEIDQVGRRLAKKMGDDSHWLREWTSMGNRVFGLGEKAQNQNHQLY